MVFDCAQTVMRRMLKYHSLRNLTAFREIPQATGPLSHVPWPSCLGRCQLGSLMIARQRAVGLSYHESDVVPRGSVGGGARKSYPAG